MNLFTKQFKFLFILTIFDNILNINIKGIKIKFHNSIRHDDCYLTNQPN
jgi:hypothetical protein